MVVDATAVTFVWGDTKIVDGFSTTIIRGIRWVSSERTVPAKPPFSSYSSVTSRHNKEQFDGAPISPLLTLISSVHSSDENKTLRENIGGGNDTVIIGGTPRHVVGYLLDYLFSPERIMAPVSSLSGGERNRLLLAKLFVIPSKCACPR